jgi:hypothetical protein
MFLSDELGKVLTLATAATNWPCFSVKSSGLVPTSSMINTTDPVGATSDCAGAGMWTSSCQGLTGPGAGTGTISGRCDMKLGAMLGREADASTLEATAVWGRVAWALTAAGGVAGRAGREEMASKSIGRMAGIGPPGTGGKIPAGKDVFTECQIAQKNALVSG